MQEQTYTLVADFSVGGDMAYLSHQETLTMFERAFIRASVPLKFSSGFNPHPRLSICFPRSVGTYSVGDRICASVQSETPPLIQETQDAIRRQLPSDCSIDAIQYLLGKQTFSPSGVRYKFRLKSLIDEAFLARLEHCHSQIQAGSPIHAQRFRPKQKKYKSVDISVFLQSLDYERDCIQVQCRVSASGTARIDELLQWLHIDIQDLREPVSRMDISWNQH